MTVSSQNEFRALDKKAAGQHLVLNGVNGASGAYLLPNLTEEDISRVAQGEILDEGHLGELEERYAEREIRHLGVKAGVDPNKLDEAGWGVIFAFDDDQVEERKLALKPLLNLRKEQAGDLYKEFDEVHAVLPKETKIKWLDRHNVGPGPADPKMVPYYLLIVASPELIPYRFQYQLNVQYAVGRIHFDTLEEYARYAQSVVMAEKGHVTRSRRLTFFGVENPDDLATLMSTQQLVEPLADLMEQEYANWEIEARLQEKTKKADLGKVFFSRDGPALLFTASHGMGFPKGDRRQVPHQGALLCQDWPGPLEWINKPIPEDHYFSGDDLGDNARVAGMVTFHFACYGAGTPLLDDFGHKAFKKRVDIAEKPFIARLPQKLLAHPRGGSLAVVGHVERAWSYSFSWPQAGPQIGVFESALLSLMAGSPVGLAMEFFSERYAELSTELSLLFEDIRSGAKPNHSDLARFWTANNDARSYAIVGDPAVRLAVP